MQDEISARILERYADAQIDIEVEGNRATIAVVSEHFADMSRVKKQQAIYACIEDFIADGTLHAVTIKAQAPNE